MRLPRSTGCSRNSADALVSRLHILHLHSSFQPGGKELRSARLINAFGRDLRHTIVSGEPGAMGAASAIDPAINVTYPNDFPNLSGRPFPARLRRMAQAMKGYDLVLSYNWGAVDAVMAHTVFRDHLSLPPLVHHEDGFNQDETEGLKTSRNWFRRIALARSSALIVPSRRLEAVALEVWQQPRDKVQLIANGIDTLAYAKKPKPDALPRIIKRNGEKWVGTLAGLRAIKNLPRLVRAFAGLPEEWQLVILGEGPEKQAIRDQAKQLNMAHRVHLPGFIADPAKAVGLFDIFALSSDSEQFPISVVEAMAAGIPVAAPAVGDVAYMVSPENRPFIVPAGDEQALARALAGLAADDDLRRRAGNANRELAITQFDEKHMISAYRTAYAHALRRNSFP